MMFTATNRLRRARLSGSRRPATTLPRRRRLRLTVEELEPYNLLSAAVPLAHPDLQATPVAAPNQNAAPLQAPGGFANGPYTPAQIQNAYGFNKLSQTGSGQTIAIVDAYDDPNIVKDLGVFDSPSTGFNLTALTPSKTIGGSSGPTFTKENESGQVIGGTGGTGGTAAPPRANANWGVEISLDVEWAHAIAPGANILLVEANSSSFSDLLKAVQTAASQASVVSMSWGSNEFSAETGSAYDGILANLVSTYHGLTLVASSGDSGALFGPEWPAVSPSVLGVGGTSLFASSTGVYSSETGWGNSYLGDYALGSYFFGGSGGGISSYESLPSYQPSSYSDGATLVTGVTNRMSPDVAYDADPNTGVYVYDSFGTGGSHWGAVGGTSVGAPQWAGLLALVDQGRLQPGGPGNPLGQAQYAIYNDYLTNKSDFNDITTGNNGYAAGVGSDLVTGLGTPKADSLVTHLITSTVHAPASTTTSSSTTSSGGTGKKHVTVADPPETATPQVTVASSVTTVAVADASRGTGAAAVPSSAATVAGVNGVSDLALLLASVRVTVPAAVTPHAPPVTTTAVPIASVRPATADGSRSLTRNYAGSATSGNDLVGQTQGDQQGQRPAPAPAPQGAPDMVPDNDDWLGNPDLAGGLRPEAIDARLAGEDGLAAEPAASSLPLLPVMGQERTLNTLALAAALVFLGGAWKVPARETDSDKDRRRV
jgi:hypothetical protein